MHHCGCAFLLLIFCTGCFIKVSDESKILAVFPTVSRSHAILGSTLLKGLAKKGHDVTMFSNFPQNSVVKNYRDLTFTTDLSKIFYENVPDRNSSNFDQIRSSPLKSLQFFMAGVHLSEAVLNDPNMQMLLHSNESFDAVIVCAFTTEPIFTIAHHFNAPLIAFTAGAASMFTNHLVGNPNHYAYIPDILISGYIDRMEFHQRLINTFINVGCDLWRYFFHFPMQNRIRAKYFPNSPDLYTIMANTSLVLVNSHFSLSYSKPLLPNLVEIGGFHVDTPKSLEEDLQRFMDEAKYGVIYFSLGSYTKFKNVPIEVKNVICKVFSELKQRVLWMYDEDTLIGQPENVWIRKWFKSQSDILAHPNMKLFITHGGLGSMTESVIRGVPIVGIPVWGDQFTNVKLAVKKGCGVSLKFSNITYESFSWAINEVLNNSRYGLAMKHASELFHDQETKPMDRAIYWIEYVIRHKGAPHLKSAAQELNRAQLLLLDVIFFVIFVISLICTIFYLVIRFFCKKIRGKMFYQNFNKKCD